MVLPFTDRNFERERVAGLHRVAIEGIFDLEASYKGAHVCKILQNSQMKFKINLTQFLPPFLYIFN